MIAADSPILSWFFQFGSLASFPTICALCLGHFTEHDFGLLPLPDYTELSSGRRNIDYTTQSDTTQLTQPHHNCIDTWACRTASATSRFILFVIWIQSPLSHNVTFVYLIRVNSTVIVPKLIITMLLWAPARYEKPKPCGTEERYSPNHMQVPLPYGD